MFKCLPNFKFDCRIVGGKEKVTFLMRIKEGLEDPQRALLDL
jgi:2-oxoglutarate dehydrogenase E2 component (dihydrolipoamide succinyltransferase)